MSATLNCYGTFFDAVLAEHSVNDYIRTLGFLTPGDGGAAMYKVTSAVTVPDTYKNVEPNMSSLRCANGFFHYQFDANCSSSTFQFIPQNNTVYAEQFGVLPDETVYYDTNTTMMNCAVEYASSNGFVLAFASKKTYYFGSSIVVKSNLLIEGNGATLCVYDNAPSDCHLFNMENSTDIQKNITVRNLTVVGRINENQDIKDQAFEDQAFHVCIDGFTLRNVTIKNFRFGVHTYGRDTNGTNEVQGDGESAAKTYVIPEIPNKNWLIDGCSITDTVTGLMLSEIDGLTVKNSKISCIIDPSDLEPSDSDPSDSDPSDSAPSDSDPSDSDPSDLYPSDLYHCIYMSSNCLNVRVANTVLCNVSGDAIHKAYSYPTQNPKFDSSKNHFYTDLTIHNADSALDIGIISQNVMCDNVFATEVEIVLQLSGADNCIISNSNFSQTRYSKERKAFVYAEKACNCWMQNSYVYYEGRHRVTNQYQQGDFLETMFENKKHRRMFIGANFDIPNHWFKFTGCEFESTYALNSCYYEEVFGDRYYSPPKSQYGEYLDNCSITIKTSSEMFRLLPVNDLLGGITYRNCYLKNISDSKNQPPFRMWCKYPALSDVSPCESNTCPVNPSFACALYATGKKYPWTRFENNIFDNFMYPVNNISWYLLLKEGKPKDTTYNAPQRSLVPNYLNAYLSNGYKLNGNVFSSILNLMKN